MCIAHICRVYPLLKACTMTTLRLALRTATLALGLGLGLLSGAQALTFKPVTLSFNDLGLPDVLGAPVPAGYGGFSWGSQWYSMTNQPDLSATYLAMGSVSSTLIRRVDGKPFYFDGATFWSRRGLDAQGNFYFVLYFQGVTVFDGTLSKKTRMEFTGNPTVIKTGYKGQIDGMAFVFKNKDYNHVAADDFKFRIVDETAP